MDDASFDARPDSTADDASASAAAPAAAAAPREGRLWISHLEVENFKSYANRRVIGPFHKSFSAVVGPNGSGKSNVIDSMLFVFGTRSNKLRMKKASELIHRSAEHPDCEHAKVTVHFEDIVDLAADELEAAGVAPTTDNNDFRRVAGSAFQVGGERGERRETSGANEESAARRTSAAMSTLTRGADRHLSEEHHGSRSVCRGGRASTVEEIQLRRGGPQDRAWEGARAQELVPHESRQCFGCRKAHRLLSTFAPPFLTLLLQSHRPTRPLHLFSPRASFTCFIRSLRPHRSPCFTHLAPLVPLPYHGR